MIKNILKKTDQQLITLYDKTEKYLKNIKSLESKDSIKKELMSIEDEIHRRKDRCYDTTKIDVVEKAEE